MLFAADLRRVVEAGNLGLLEQPVVTLEHTLLRLHHVDQLALGVKR